MERDEAIDYLEDKGLIKETKRKFTQDEEDKIQEVMKKGKIYGDPHIEL